MNMFANPQLAYKAGFALVDPTTEIVDARLFRHVTEHGVGMVFTVPREAVELEVLVRSTGHGDIYGAPLEEVAAAAIEKRALQ